MSKRPSCTYFAFLLSLFPRFVILVMASSDSEATGEGLTLATNSRRWSTDSSTVVSARHGLFHAHDGLRKENLLGRHIEAGEPSQCRLSLVLLMLLNISTWQETGVFRATRTALSNARIVKSEVSASL